jgi:hypothetical protein
MSKVKKDVLETSEEQNTLVEEQIIIPEENEIFDREQFKKDLRAEMLQELGMDYLNKNFNKADGPVEVKKEVVVKELPRKIIYEIKGLDDENATLNGAYLPGKVVGKTEFRLVQQITNRNSTYLRENDYYVTGLEPEFYENDSRLTKEVLDKRLHDIRIAKQFLENRYKKSLDPKNHNFWKDIRFTLDDIGLVYSTTKMSSNQNNDSLLMYYVILAGGCEDIAASYEEAKQWNKMYYLTVKQDESVRAFGKTKDKLQASAKLNEIYQNWKKEDVLYLLYALNLRTNHGYHLDTPIEMIVEEFDDFISGKNFKLDKQKKAGEFLELVTTYEQEPDLVKIKGLFLAADYFGYVSFDNKAKEYKNRSTGTIYGSTLESAITKLLNPKYIEDFVDLKNKVMNKWKN